LRQLPRIETTLVIGKYAHDYHFGKSNLTVSRLVENWQQHWPRRLPLPHPSPRNNIWLKKNPWFETMVVPVIRARITHLLKT
jgi:uracil-DNA glycosylase